MKNEKNMWTKLKVYVDENHNGHNFKLKGRIQDISVVHSLVVVAAKIDSCLIISRLSFLDIVLVPQTSFLVLFLDGGQSNHLELMTLFQNVFHHLVKALVDLLQTLNESLPPFLQGHSQIKLFNISIIVQLSRLL